MSEETASDIYKQLNELRVIVVRIDARTERGEREHEKFDKRLEDQDARIRSLEDARNKGAGIIAALTTVASLVGGFVVWAAGRLFK